MPAQIFPNYLDVLLNFTPGYDISMYKIVCMLTILNIEYNFVHILKKYIRHKKVCIVCYKGVSSYPITPYKLRYFYVLWYYLTTWPLKRDLYYKNQARRRPVAVYRSKDMKNISLYRFMHHTSVQANTVFAMVAARLVCTLKPTAHTLRIWVTAAPPKESWTG